MAFVEKTINSPWDGVIVTPTLESSAAGSPVGVLVLAGSSGRIETDRCRLLAGAGMTAMSIRWFGGAGQPPGICEIPLETFTAAIDLLIAEGAERVGVLGVSKGAEAALLLTVRDPRVDAVVALSPTSVAWANVGPGADGMGRPCRSSWTWRGVPVPFVPYDDDWVRVDAPGEPVAYRTHYEHSRRTYADAAREAAIPIERSGAEIVLVAGGDDQMWPALEYARELAARRPVRLIEADKAGHRPRLPGEGPAVASDRFRYGGTPAADAALGAQAWPDIVRVLRGSS